MNHERALIESKSRTVMKLLTAVVIFTAAVLVSLVAYWLLRPEPFQPSTYDTARVLTVTEEGVVIVPQVAGYDAPSIFARERAVPVSFTRCSEADEPYEATARTWWVSTLDGHRVELETVNVQVPPGCLTLRTVIDMPQQVWSDVTAPGALGVVPDEQRWYLEGDVTPTRDGGEPAHWTSETFLIVNATSTSEG